MLSSRQRAGGSRKRCEGSPQHQKVVIFAQKSKWELPDISVDLAQLPDMAKTSVDYKDDLLLALSPLLVILLAFGGRWSILAACFGGTICYIFDIVGVVEVSRVTVAHAQL